MTLQNETKYIVPWSRVPFVRQWLDGALRKDRFFPANIVRSIYYDTADHHCLAEVDNGDYLKAKVRLRCYAYLDGSSDGSHPFLEIKRKIGFARHKDRFPIQCNAEVFSAGCISENALPDITHYLRDEPALAGQRFFPIFRSSFKRHRYLEPTTGTRISLDYDIAVDALNTALSPANVPLMSNSAVLEIKGGSGDLPQVLRQIVQLGGKKSSFSKFKICFDMINAAVPAVEDK